MNTTALTSGLLTIVLSLLTSCSSSNKNGAPAKQDSNQEADSSRTNTVSDASAESSSLNPLADNVVGKIAETSGNLRLTAEVEGGVITLAKAEIIKDDTVDQEATGQVIFRLIYVENIDGEELTPLDMTARECGEDEEENEDSDCGDIECEADDCPLEIPLVNGVASLFDEQTAFNVGEHIASNKDEIELQAVYKTTPPQETEGRFELGVE